MHTLFSALLLTAIISLPTSAMEQPRSNPISNQQAMRIIGAFCLLHEQSKISIQIPGRTTIHDMLVPAKSYTVRELRDWIKQEWLNNALWLAVANNKPIMEIAALIATGAQANHRYNYTKDRHPAVTALHKAAGDHNVPIVRLLLQHGSAVNQKNSLDQTPLDLAINGYKDAKKYCGYRSSSIAQCREVIALLQAHGAQHNQKDFDAIIL